VLRIHGAFQDTLLVPVNSDSKAKCGKKSNFKEPQGILLLLWYFSLCTGCGKIGDLEKAKKGEFSWLVSLVHKNGIENEPLCWGTLINDRYVLSAAHCTSK